MCECSEPVTTTLAVYYEDGMRWWWYEISQICCQLTGAEWLCVAMFAVGVIVTPIVMGGLTQPE